MKYKRRNFFSLREVAGDKISVITTNKFKINNISN